MSVAVLPIPTDSRKKHRGNPSMNIYDPISLALGIQPMNVEQLDMDELKSQSTINGRVGLPDHIYGTQDRSFMQTPEYKNKQSDLMKQVWNNNPARKAKSKANIQQATRKKVLAEGAVFDSLTLCAEHYGVSLETIRLWMRKGKDFKYV